MLDFLQNDIQPLKLTNQDKLSPHGKEVIEQVMAEGSMPEFIKNWRRNFMSNDPKFMPNGWRIDHKIERSFGEHSCF